MKNLLGIEALERTEIEAVLRRTQFFQPLQNESFKKLDTLRGRVVLNLFYEASTRTRVSFEIAAKRLGADSVSIAAQGSSASKGESLVDTLNTLPRCVRTLSSCGMLHRRAAFPSRHLPNTPIINAGDGTHEHPTQALLDARTILDHTGDSKAFVWPSSATSLTAASPGRTSTCCRSSARRSFCAVPPPAPARIGAACPGVTLDP